MSISGKGELMDIQWVTDIVDIIEQLKVTNDLHCAIKNIDTLSDDQYSDVENFQLVHRYEEWEDSKDVTVSITDNNNIKEINIVDKIDNPFVIYDTMHGIVKVFVNGKDSLETVMDSQEGIVNQEKIGQLKNTLLYILRIQQKAA